jgi:hypothetical protein
LRGNTRPMRPTGQVRRRAAPRSGAPPSGKCPGQAKPHQQAAGASCRHRPARPPAGRPGESLASDRKQSRIGNPDGRALRHGSSQEADDARGRPAAPSTQPPSGAAAQPNRRPQGCTPDPTARLGAGPAGSHPPATRRRSRSRTARHAQAHPHHKEIALGVAKAHGARGGANVRGKARPLGTRAQPRNRQPRDRQSRRCAAIPRWRGRPRRTPPLRRRRTASPTQGPARRCIPGATAPTA